MFAIVLHYEFCLGTVHSMQPGFKCLLLCCTMNFVLELSTECNQDISVCHSAALQILSWNGPQYVTGILVFAIVLHYEFCLGTVHSM